MTRAPIPTLALLGDRLKRAKTRIRRAALAFLTPALAIGDRTPATPSALGGSAGATSEGTAIGGDGSAVGGAEQTTAVGGSGRAAPSVHLGGPGRGGLITLFPPAIGGAGAYLRSMNMFTRPIWPA
eukprot:4338252-Alexandrium_andersonii.AAC.1